MPIMLGFPAFPGLTVAVLRVTRRVTHNGANAMRYLQKANGYWRYVRRVPLAYADIDNRTFVQRSTDIKVLDDPRAIRAREVAERINHAEEDRWAALKRGETPSALADYDAAISAARKLGISAPIDNAAQRTIDELLARIDALTRHNAVDDRGAALAVFDAVKAPALTFRQAAERYIEAHRESWSNKQHAKQWGKSLALHVYPTIGAMAVADVGTESVMSVLRPMWSTKPSTGKRVRSRIEAVLDWSKVSGYRDGDNPARWRGHLAKLLAAPGKIRTVEHFDAMPYADVPAFMVKLRSDTQPAARALEFTILTAARTGEALAARLSEIDKKERVWTIPAARMKARKPHRVPLSDAAMAIVNRCNGEYLFVGRKPGTHLTHNTLRNQIARMKVDVTPHGFRASFKSWADEQTDFPTHIVEMALAHTIGNQVEAAYRRGDLLAKRRDLMTAWASYVAGAATSEQAPA
jgi:integrase